MSLPATHSNQKPKHKLERHPQRQKVWSALAAGESAQSIAKWIAPKISHTAIWRYNRDVVQPYIEKTKSLIDQAHRANPSKPPVSPNEVGAVSMAEHALTRAAERFRARQEDLEAGIKAARSEADLKALAALIGVDVKAIEAEAKLLGLGAYALERQGSGPSIVVVMPHQQQLPEMEAEVIDVEPIEVGEG